jgi:hypothetical protein
VGLYPAADRGLTLRARALSLEECESAATVEVELVARATPAPAHADVTWRLAVSNAVRFRLPDGSTVKERRRRGTVLVATGGTPIRDVLELCVPLDRCAPELWFYLYADVREKVGGDGFTLSARVPHFAVVMPGD